MPPVIPCILAIDASTGPCSVALWHDGKISAYIETLKTASQAGSLLPMVENAMAQSNLSYKDLTAVAATVGPGSFTGIRIGLASAKGIAFAAGITQLGYTTLDALAYAAHLKNPSANQRILAIINAGKGECYYQCFDGLSPISQAQVGTLEAAMALAGAGDVTVAGNVMVEATGFSPCGITFPRADTLAKLAANETLASQALRPFYIRPPDAKLPNVS